MSQLTLKNAHVGDPVTGSAMLKSVKFGSNARGTWMTGSVGTASEEIPIKIWDDTLASTIKENQNNYVGKVVLIQGITSSYNNRTDIEVYALELIDEDPADFLSSDLDLTSLSKQFMEFVPKVMSPAAINVLNAIFAQEGFSAEFMQAFAAKSMHDNEKGGLLNHTFKCMRIMDTLIRVENAEKYRDLLMLGVTIHDIGKVLEMKMGIYQPNSFVTHRVFGVQMLTKLESVILQNFDADFYYRLISIVEGHHDIYGDPATTVYAKITHMVDMLEAFTTRALAAEEKGEYTTDTGGKYITVDNHRLYY